ncbi:MAG: ABC transporter ATP-binding protein/permease [Streptococcaceae bacterium]|jgi:ATP-binding cassette subfamily B protein|nr:ABC transporter ATP-binding protein/permease [Streptococcaceae bacterium]
MLKLARTYLQFWPTLGAIFFLLVQVILNLMLPNITASIINNGIAKSNMAYIWQMGAVMLIVALISWAAAVVNVYFASTQSQRLGKLLRNDLFHKTIFMDDANFQKFGDATLITRTTDDINQITNVTQTMLRMMLQSPLTLIGAIFMAWTLDHNLILIFVVAIPLLALTAWINMSIAIPRFRQMQSKIDAINLVFQQGLTGVRVIRAFNRDPYEIEKFDGANQDLTRTSRFVLTTVAMLSPIMTVILSLANIAIVWFGAHLIGRGLMGMGNLVAFLTYATQILLSFMQLTGVMVQIPRAQVAAQRVNQVLDTEDIVKAPENPVAAGNKLALTFNRASYRFPGAERDAVSDIHAEIQAGQTLAIIGGTGSGKSTLLNLIARLIDVSTGKISLNGVDLRQLSSDELHSKISLTQQKAVLFSGTVRSNLQFGKTTASEEEMWEALEIAQAADFVREQGGLDMQVEQNGNNFSGGQKQRLSIARTLIKDAEVYLFDDSFSALDFATDAKLRAAINHSAKHQPAIKVIVAQRIATVMNADQILVLENGQQVALGSHAELAKTSPEYQDIMRSQLSDDDLANLGVSLKAISADRSEKGGNGREPVSRALGEKGGVVL